jgi:hypothetical protein
VLIGLQSFTGGDPDLYISYGDDNLPDKENFDFKSTTYGSEVMTLNLQDPYFARNHITSLKGLYTFAVYGKMKSTFILSANQDEFPIMPLQDNIPLSNSQRPYETRLYKFESSQAEPFSDIQITLEPTRGKCDMYVNTYDQADDSQTIV